jgi:hypothetical protein
VVQRHRGTSRIRWRCPFGTAPKREISIYRQLAASNSARYLPALARSLNNLSQLLSRTGRATEGLPLAQESVAIRRELARRLPGLALALRALGYQAAAAQATAEASAIRGR